MQPCDENQTIGNSVALIVHPEPRCYLMLRSVPKRCLLLYLGVSPWML